MIEVGSGEDGLRSLVDAGVLARSVKHVAHHMVNVGKTLKRPRGVSPHLGNEVEGLAFAHENDPTGGALVDRRPNPRVGVEVAQNQILFSVRAWRPVAEVDEDSLDLPHTTILIVPGHARSAVNSDYR
jgi:hypothetical protein